MGSTMGKLLRGLSGAVTAGVVVLTLVVIGAAVVGNERSFPGPGPVSIGWHVVASIVTVTAQWHADRRRGVAAVAGSVAVFVATGLLLWTQWWD